MAFASRGASDLADLPLEDQAERAFNKILRSASAREQSSARIKEKLACAGFSSEVIQLALTRAQHAHIIDDHRYADCLIRSTLAQGKGLELASKEIEDLGISLSSLDAYQEFLEDHADHMTERALEVLRNHHTSSKNLWASCHRKLISKGYSNAVATEATRIFCQQHEEDQASACLL